MPKLLKIARRLLLLQRELLRTSPRAPKHRNRHAPSRAPQRAAQPLAAARQPPRTSRCAYASRRTMPRPRRRALVLLLATTNALVIRLEAGARECFLLDVSKEAAVSGNFELISEGVTPEPLGVVGAARPARTRCMTPRATGRHVRF